MFRSDKEEKTPAIVKKQQPTMVKHQVAAADSKKLPAQWEKVGTNCTSLIAGFLSNDNIAGFLSNDNKAAANLTQTCRFLYHGTKGALAGQKLKTLARHVVVEPNEDKVIAMLSREPTLVNAVIKEVIDPSGRILINNTIFQLAFGAGDPEMCLAMKPFFEKVYGNEKTAIQEMERQRSEKFAEDKKEDEGQDKQAKDHTQSLLVTAITAITAEQFNLGGDANNKLILSPATLAAIETFRKKFAESQPKRIDKGMHFRNNTLLETYNAYVQAAAQWNYNYRRCALFEDAVLSCVLSYAPANDAQRFSQGLYYLQERSEKFTRSLALRNGKNNFYLECRNRSSELSLVGSCSDIYARRSVPLSDVWDGRFAGRLTKLMSNKNVKLAELMRVVEPRPEPRCVIC